MWWTAPTVRRAWPAPARIPRSDRCQRRRPLQTDPRRPPTSTGDCGPPRRGGFSRGNGRSPAADVGFAARRHADLLNSGRRFRQRGPMGDSVLRRPGRSDRLARNRLPNGRSWSPSFRTAVSRRPWEEAGGQIIRTPVGDKYILEGMLVTGPSWAARRAATSSSSSTPPVAMASSRLWRSCPL